MPRVLHEHVAVALADRLPVSTANFSLDFKVKRFLRGAGASAETRHATWLGSFTPEEQTALLGRAPSDVFDEQRRAFAAAPTRDPLERLVYLYATTYLQDDILFKVDRASMATLARGQGAVPRRRARGVPGTGAGAAEAAAARDEAPPQARDGGPSAGRDRRTRQEGLRHPGRGVAQDRPSGAAAGRALARARPPSGALRSGRVVERLVSEHLAGRRDHRKQLWTLFMFQLWHRRWIEGRDSSDATPRRRALQPARGRVVAPGRSHDGP